MNELETHVCGGLQAARTKLEQAISRKGDPQQALYEASGALQSVSERLKQENRLDAIPGEVAAFLGALLPMLRGLAEMIASLREQAKTGRPEPPQTAAEVASRLLAEPPVGAVQPMAPPVATAPPVLSPSTQPPVKDTGVGHWTDEPAPDPWRGRPG